MLRFTQDPSTGRLVQCLAKNYKNDSIVSIDMDKVGVMAAYCDRLCVCVVHCIGRHTHTYTMGHARACVGVCICNGHQKYFTRFTK